MLGATLKDKKGWRVVRGGGRSASPPMHSLQGMHSMLTWKPFVVCLLLLLLLLFLLLLLL